MAKMLALAKNTILTTPLKKSFESSLKLFAAAFVRERARNLRDQVTAPMEAAALGCLICAISLDDTAAVRRALLRVTDLAMIAPLTSIPLACAASGLLYHLGES